MTNQPNAINDTMAVILLFSVWLQHSGLPMAVTYLMPFNGDIRGNSVVDDQFNGVCGQ